jgi:hypothetical protein
MSQFARILRMDGQRESISGLIDKETVMRCLPRAWFAATATLVTFAQLVLLQLLVRF